MTEKQKQVLRQLADEWSRMDSEEFEKMLDQGSTGFWYDALLYALTGEPKEGLLAEGDES